MQAQQYGAKLILTGDTVQNLTGGELVINWEVQNGYSE
jgi:hypothetical protein